MVILFVWGDKVNHKISRIFDISVEYGQDENMTIFFFFVNTHAIQFPCL